MHDPRRSAGDAPQGVDRRSAGDAPQGVDRRSAGDAPQGTSLRAPRAPLVGRDDVRARIARHVAGTGPPVVLALLGGAGIGKSRLADDAILRARGAGCAVLVGHANPVDAALPLGVFRDALRAARRRGELPADVADPLGARFPAWLLPELGSAGEVERDVLFESATCYLRALGARAGLLVVLEDVQEAAVTSLALVAHLARTLADAPVRILLTARPDEGGRELGALRHELVRTRRGEEIHLPPLPAPDIARVVGALTGHAPSPAALDALGRVSGGNPYVLEEVVRAAVERGRLDPATGAWRGDDPIALPWSVREMLVARSRTLPHADQELLRVAAVAGEEVDPLLLGRVAGLRPDRLARSLGRLRAAGMIAAPERVGDDVEPVRFRHALAREAILADMLGAERVACHARILAALERRPAGTPAPRVEQLLAHALGAGDGERAVRYSLQAGLRARALGAHAEAEGHLARARGLLSEDVDERVHARVLLEHGRTLSATAHRAQALEALRAARRAAVAAGDRACAAEALALAAETRLEMDVRGGVVEDLARATAELEGEAAAAALRTAVRARLARAHLLLGDPAASEAAAAAALAEDGDEVTERALRITLGAARAALGDLGRGVDELEAVLRACEESGDHLGALRAHLALAACHRDRLDDQIRHADAAVAVARGRGLPRLLLDALWRRAALDVESGSWADADARADEAEALLALAGPDPAARMGLTVVRGMRARRTGDLATAVECYSAVAEESARLGIAERELEARVGLARARLSAGDPDGAHEALAPALERWAARPGASASPVVALLLTATEVAAVAGDVAASRAAADAVALRSPGPRARYARALAAAAGGIVPPPGELEDAARAVESTGRRPEAARMRMAAAEVLSRLPAGRDQAGDLAARALGLYRAMDAGAWGERAESLLRALGRRVPARAGGGAAGLTPREAEVLGLIAEGLSNRAIAERLVISEATVARHVFNLFARLGVHTRAQAVAVALGAAAAS